MHSDVPASRNGGDINMGDMDGAQKDEELTLEDTDILLTGLMKEYSNVDSRRMQLNGRIQGLFAHKRALQGDDAVDVESYEVPGLVPKVKKPAWARNGKVDTRKRLVRCINCYIHDLPCDRGDVCMSCTKSHKPYKRAKCEHFASGTCTRTNCHRAHEGEDCPITVHAGPVFKASKKAKKNARKRGSKQKQEQGQQTPTQEDEDAQEDTPATVELAVRPKRKCEEDDRGDDGMKRARTG